MASEGKKFQQFLRDRRFEIVSIVVVIIALYLPKLTNFSYSIDSEGMISDPRGLLRSWIAINRFGLALLSRLFLYGADLNPYFSNVITYLLMAFSGILLLYLLYRTTSIPRYVQLIGVMIYLLSPVHFEQTMFVMQSAQVMLGFVLIFMSLLVAGLPDEQTSKPRLVVAVLLLVAGFSIYTSLIVGFVTLVVVLMHLRQLEDRPTSVKEYIKPFGRYVLIFLASVSIFLVVANVVKWILRVPSTEYLTPVWGTAPFSKVFNSAMTQYIAWFGHANIPFHIEWITLLGIVALVVVLISTSVRRRLNWSVMLDVVLEYLLALSPLILTGNVAGPIRALTPTVPLIFMAYVVTILLEFSGRWVRLGLSLAASGMIFIQAKTTSDLEQTDLLVYQSEVDFSHQILEKIQERGISDYSEYKLAVVGSKLFLNPITVTGEVVGSSHFNWDQGSPIGSNARIRNFLLAQGYNFGELSKREYHSALKQSKKMSTFPNKKGLVIKGDVIIINLTAD